MSTDGKSGAKPFQNRSPVFGDKPVKFQVVRPPKRGCSLERVDAKKTQHIYVVVLDTTGTTYTFYDKRDENTHISLKPTITGDHS